MKGVVVILDVGIAGAFVATVPAFCSECLLCFMFQYIALSCLCQAAALCVGPIESCDRQGTLRSWLNPRQKLWDRMKTSSNRSSRVAVAAVVDVVGGRASDGGSAAAIVSSSKE